MGRLKPYSQTLGQAGKTSQGKHSSLLYALINYDYETFVNIGRRENVIKLFKP
jgi:hypothetical protein